MTADLRLEEALRSVLNDPAHRMHPELVGLDAVHQRAAHRRHRAVGVAAVGVGLVAVLSLAVFTGLSGDDASELPVTPPTPSLSTDAEVVTDTSALPTCSATDFEFNSFEGPRSVPVGSAYLVRLAYARPACALREAPILRSDDVSLGATTPPPSGLLVVRPDDYLDLVVTSATTDCPSADLATRNQLSLNWSGGQVDLSDAALPTCGSAVTMTAKAAPATTVAGIWDWLGWDWANTVDPASEAGAAPFCVQLEPDYPILNPNALNARFMVVSSPPDSECRLRPDIRLISVDENLKVRTVASLPEMSITHHGGDRLTLQIRRELASCTEPIEYRGEPGSHFGDEPILALVYGDQRVQIIGPITSCPGGLSVGRWSVR